MKKLIYPDSNQVLSEALQGQFATFIDNDRFYGHVKQASSNAITQQMLEDCKPDKDHFLIHFVAVGDYEKYGFNKNADSFPKLANQKYFKTFETDANLFREHKSDSKYKAIGIIKKAAYNEEMGRIEVAAWANIKKASEEYEKARRGETLSCSMGMRCPCDRDNISGKLSKTPRDYEPWMKARPCQYIDSWDGKPIRKYAFVHNDNFKFFDLSIVAKPAERIAHYLEYKFASADENDMLKAAAANNNSIPSALLADMEGLTYKCNTLPTNKLILLKKLASLEKVYNEGNLDYVKHVANNTFYKKSSEELNSFNNNIKSLKQVRPATLFRELAKRASILSFNDFMDVFYSDTDAVKDVEKHNNAVKYASIMLIPNVFKNLDDAMCSLLPEDESCCEAEAIFDAGSTAETCLDTSKDPVQGFMDDVEDKLSLDKAKVGNRVIKITLTINLDDCDNKECCSVVKEANTIKDPDTIKLAKRYANEYALYKLAALNDIATFKGKDSVMNDITLLTTIAQNHII